MVEFGTSSAFRGWVRVRVLGYGFGVRGRKVKSRDCALASDLVRAVAHAARASWQDASGRALLAGRFWQDAPGRSYTGSLLNQYSKALRAPRGSLVLV